MKTLYAIPSHQCNLNCPHCTIKDSPEIFNYDKFMEQLNKFDGAIVLFGGEPAFNKERSIKIYNDNKKNGLNKIGSVSTNLLILDDVLLNIYTDIGYIATSWNMTRFSNIQYTTWLKNCHQISTLGINTVVLITLTEDLITTNGMNEFLKCANNWDTSYFKNIQFEYYIGDHEPGYYDRVDNWLCELYKVWDNHIPINLFKSDYICYNDCSEIYTLFPDGTLLNTCPNGMYINKHVPSECLLCEKSGKCRPCILQENCSYPKKLRELIESEVK